MENRIAIRTVHIFSDKIDDKRRLFGFEVNGVRIFAKGGDWVPADSVYARVSDEKYRTLVEEAKNANFNMLRIWGGGLYEREAFYNACDEYGIMLWQDFMYACALYPDDRRDFREEAEREIDWQTKTLSKHACLAMFSGNNENHECYSAWYGGEKAPKFFGGAQIYHYIIPEMIEKNCPEVPYWRGSPYGGEYVDYTLEGDTHPWGKFFMNADMERRITPSLYDELDASFVSEYGYIGPCKMKSTLQYLDGAPLDRNGEVWNHHNNTFEKNTVVAGIAKHFSASDELTIDEYLTYAGVCQGMMLGSSLEAFRAKQLCWGSMFWMYNDTWGEVGWTIIDYYLRRKISYYYVARALNPYKLIIRKKGEMINVSAVNESADEIDTTLTLSLVNFNGEKREIHKEKYTIKPRSHGKLFEIAYARHKDDEVIALVSDNELYNKVILAEKPVKDMLLPSPKLSITELCEEGNDLSFTVTSDKYAYGVHFGLDDDIKLSDEYFELLPGEKRRVVAYGAVSAGIKLITAYSVK